MMPCLRLASALLSSMTVMPVASFASQPVSNCDAEGRTYFAYVAAESADEVYLVQFDGESASVVRRIDVGVLPTEIEGPHGLTVDPSGDFWYLTMAHGIPYGTLYKYRTANDELMGRVELGLFPATLQMSVDTGLLYCVNFDLHGDMTPSSVSIVDPEEMVEVARTTTGPMPHGSRLSPDGRFHYSCAMMTDELFEIDAASFDVTRTLRLTDGTGGIARKRSDGHHAAVTKPTWVHPHPKKNKLFVCLNGAAQVVEVDRKAWRITRRFPTAKGPYNVEVTPKGDRFVVTYKGAASVGVWDTKSGEELERIPTTRRITHGVAISSDSRYAFVSSEGIGGESGTVDVIDLETNELVATVEVGLQAGGITFWKVEESK
ncbi:MAG: DNA-binding beta-propeller fold protein YncE [Planctomycetota bacterium]|jgi:DNA-binding beta-propeller fold protein YncE